MSLIKAVSVECPDLKADCSSYNKLLSRKKTDRELATCFSRIFERIGKTDMGRKLLISFCAPPLYSGLTLAIFQWLGKLFVDIERLSNLHKRFANIVAIFLSARTLTPSYPEALLVEVLSIMANVCLIVNRGML